MNNKTICQVHDEIMKIALDITHLNPKNYETAQDLYEQAEAMADDIYSLADDAAMMGTKMENRLQEYREAIEGLGFEKIKIEGIKKVTHDS